MKYLLIFQVFLLSSSNVSCALWINKYIDKYQLPSFDSSSRYCSLKRNKMQYTGVMLTAPILSDTFVKVCNFKRKMICFCLFYDKIWYMWEKLRKTIYNNFNNVKIYLVQVM